MKRKWIDRGEMIGKFRCISLEGPESEKCLAGEKGEIWENGSSLKAFQVRPGGSEKIFRFEYKDLAKWVTRLQVPASRAKQALLANAR